MQIKDTYQTFQGPCEGIFKDRGSKFIAYGFPVYSREEAFERLEEVKKQHPKARHHCYAYRLGIEGEDFRANDDGEPSGTAGKPILGQLIKSGLTNVLIVVVRYFGGTLLGASGLINAYKNSSALAIENGSILEKVVEQVFRITFEYQWMSQVMNAVKKYSLEIVSQSFEEIAVVEIAIRKSEIGDLIPKLTAGILDLPVETIPEDLPSGLMIEPGIG